MNKTTMVMPYEFEIVFKALPLEEAGRLILAIYAYEQNGIEPDFSHNPMLCFSWETHIKPKIDENIEKYNAICQARRVAGSKGGKTTQENQKETNQANAYFDKQNNQLQTNQAEYDGDGDGEYDGDYVKRKNIKKEKPTKHKYGQYQNVLLTDAELEKLQTEFPTDWQERVERVSEYCASTGKHYNNFLATIRNWAKKDRPNIIPLQKNDVKGGLEQALALLGEQNG